MKDWTRAWPASCHFCRTDFRKTRGLSSGLAYKIVFLFCFLQFQNIFFQQAMQNTSNEFFAHSVQNLKWVFVVFVFCQKYKHSFNDRHSLKSFALSLEGSAWWEIPLQRLSNCFAICPMKYIFFHYLHWVLWTHQIHTGPCFNDSSPLKISGRSFSSFFYDTGPNTNFLAICCFHISRSHSDDDPFVIYAPRKGHIIA